MDTVTLAEFKLKAYKMAQDQLLMFWDQSEYSGKCLTQEELNNIITNKAKEIFRNLIFINWA